MSISNGESGSTSSSADRNARCAGVEAVDVRHGPCVQLERTGACRAGGDLGKDGLQLRPRPFHASELEDAPCRLELPPARGGALVVGGQPGGGLPQLGGRIRRRRARGSTSGQGERLGDFRVRVLGGERKVSGALLDVVERCRDPRRGARCDRRDRVAA